MELFYLGIVLPSEISLFLQMKHHCYVDASYLALVCMFGKCGMIDYFHHSRSFALVSAHQENFFHPLWLFTIYTIHTKVIFFCNKLYNLAYRKGRDDRNLTLSDSVVCSPTPSVARTSFPVSKPADCKTKLF